MTPLKIRNKLTDTRYDLLDTVPGGYNFMSRKGKKKFISKSEVLENFVVTKWQGDVPAYDRTESVEQFMERAVE